MGKQATEMLKGTLEGIVARDPRRPVRVRLRDHGVAARSGLLRHRRGHHLRPARQDRAARPRRRGEGPVREGAAAQGVLAQRAGARSTSTSSGGRGASSQNGIEQLRHRSEDPRKKESRSWPQSGSRSITGLARGQEAYRQYKARIDGFCPSRTARRSKAFERYLMYSGGVTDGDHARARCSDDFADLWERAAADGTPVRDDRRRRPGGVRRDVRRSAYAGKRWIDKERARLTEAIERRRAGGGGSNDHRRQPSASRASRSPSRSCTCCAASTSTWRGAASSPCSARTAPARPRS